MDRKSILRHIRAFNLNCWARRLGRSSLAERVGEHDCNHLNQLLTCHGSFGDKVAGKYEKALNLPALWMDMPHRELWSAEERSTLDKFLSPIMLASSSDIQSQES